MASTLLEATCKTILREIGTVYSDKDDLPKLYKIASSALGLSPSTHTDEMFKSIFGSASTLARCVGELRNRAGDAHGKAQGTLPLPRSHAELAVNVAGSVACFLITSFESYIAANKRRDSEGRIVLRFDKATVWRLRDHAANASESLPDWTRKKPKPGLWLVGDSGVYLMSNGSPPISRWGDIFVHDPDVLAPRLTAPAEGCDARVDDIDDWWPIHNAIDGGNDFSMTLPLKAIDIALETAEKQIVLLVGKGEIRALSDVNYALMYPM
jgi:hypothetical protein